MYNNNVDNSKHQPHTNVHVAAIAGIPRCLKCVVEASENSNFVVDFDGKLASGNFGTCAITETEENITLCMILDEMLY